MAGPHKFMPEKAGLYCLLLTLSNKNPALRRAPRAACGPLQLLTAKGLIKKPDHVPALAGDPDRLE